MRKWLLLALVAVPFLLLAGALYFYFAIAYRGPIAPAVDYDAEFRALSESIQGGPVSDWSSVEALSDAYAQMTTPGDPRTAKEAFDAANRSYDGTNLAPAIQTLGPWATQLDAAQLRDLAQAALQARPYIPELDASMGPSDRDLARALNLDAQIAIQRRDVAHALDAIQAGFAQAEIYRTRPILLSQFTAIAKQALFFERALDLATNANVTEPELQRLAQTLAAIPAPNETAVLEGERIQMSHQLENLLSESLFTQNSRSAQLLKLEELFAQLKAEIANDSLDPAAWAQRSTDLAGKHDLIASTLSVYVQYAASEQRFRTHRNAVQLVTAIERFRRSNGMLPNSPQDLVPDQLAAIPADTVSGQPFIYRQTDHALGYTLYSVGLDGIDQGGTNPSDNRLLPLTEAVPSDAVFVPK